MYAQKIFNHNKNMSKIHISWVTRMKIIIDLLAVLTRNLFITKQNLKLKYKLWELFKCAVIFGLEMQPIVCCSNLFYSWYLLLNGHSLDLGIFLFNCNLRERVFVYNICSKNCKFLTTFFRLRGLKKTSSKIGREGDVQ
jgi:hypothetical protein